MLCKEKEKRVTIEHKEWSQMSTKKGIDTEDSNPLNG